MTTPGALLDMAPSHGYAVTMATLVAAPCPQCAAERLLTLTGSVIDQEDRGRLLACLEVLLTRHACDGHPPARWGGGR